MKMALSFQKPARYRQRRDFHSNLSYRFLITAADPSHSFRMTFNVLIQGSWGRPSEGAVAHAVRLRYSLVVMI